MAHYGQDNSPDDDEEQDRRHLLRLPSLVTDSILKFLTGKELMSLRSVCKTTKTWASNSNRRCWTGYRLEIRPDFEGWKTFADAANARLNVTSIFINNPGDDGLEIYNSPGVLSFLDAFGPYIRKLKVQSFGTCISDREFTFFDSLTNLTELKLQVVDARQRPVRFKDMVRFPRSFQNLKVLKFGDIMSPRDEPPFKTTYHWDLVGACPSLKFLRFPVASQDYEVPATNVDIDKYYEPVMSYINMQTASPVGLTLRILDLKYVIGSGEQNVMVIGYPVFLMYLHFDQKDLIQVRNAYAEMVFPTYTDYQRFPRYKESCNGVIQSLINLHDATQELEPSNFTKLSITSPALLSNHRCPAWPELKELAVVISSNVLHLHTVTMTVLGLLNATRVLPNANKLVIVFDEDISVEDANYAKLINSRILSQNFYNLKVLEITRWNPKNAAFLKLWEGLDHLEELTIEDCTTFGNVALIGTDTRNPVFLRLKKLKKLRLKLDLMPLITDRACRDVFAKMNIKEFYLKALDPLEKVTESGILSLMEGEFGKSIERFPFHSWSLASLSFSDFRKLGRRFRSIL